jgi:S-adenosylmethionine hydrolase
MKAVILTICSSAKIVDISHNISKFNIRMGAFILASASEYFPRGTIHVAVVDPGVGANRRPLLIETTKSFFIGPDNGLLVLAAEKQGIKRIYELTNADLMLKKVSSTFHGRDIFAPAAAHLLRGVIPKSFGPQTSELVKPMFVEVTKTKKSLIGEVLHIDGFGNIITNIGIEDFTQNPCGKLLHVESTAFKLILKFCKSYSDAKLGELLIFEGSHGFLEISANQNNAAKMLKIQPGYKIVMSIQKNPNNSNI